MEVDLATSMSGVVQLAFVKSLAIWDDLEIYADTIGFVVTLQLAQIQTGDVLGRNAMVCEAFVFKYVAWKKKLTTFTC